MMNKIIKAVPEHPESRDRWVLVRCTMEGGYPADMSVAEYNYRMFKQEHECVVLTDDDWDKLDHLVHEMEVQHAFEETTDGRT